jgi:hypothetical protein
MTFYPALLIVGTVVAHKPVHQSHFVSRSHPADFEHLAALGEAYHNAWSRCVDRTTTWLMDDLKVDQKDPSFDNGYYVEYDIENRVPRTYDILRELLGWYWPRPVFRGQGNDLRVTNSYLSTVLTDAQVISVIPDLPGLPNDDELPDPFVNNAA